MDKKEDQRVKDIVDERFIEELPRWVSILNKLWKLAGG